MRLFYLHQATHGDILSPSSNSHADGNHERRHNRGPRNYGYNPRRGRNSGGPRPPFGGYNPSPMQMQSGGRGRYGAPHNDFPTYRMQDGRQGRRSGPNGGRHRPTYPQDAGNGGMFVYLPPEMAAMYRPQGMPVMQQPPYNGRRNHGRRRNFERRSGQPRTAPGFNGKLIFAFNPVYFCMYIKVNVSFLFQLSHQTTTSRLPTQNLKLNWPKSALIPRMLVHRIHPAQAIGSWHLSLRRVAQT